MKFFQIYQRSFTVWTQLRKKLETIKNDYGVARDRIIITYDKKDAQELAEFLGLPAVNCDLQVSYDFNTIKANKKFGLF